MKISYWGPERDTYVFTFDPRELQFLKFPIKFLERTGELALGSEREYYYYDTVVLDFLKDYYQINSNTNNSSWKQIGWASFSLIKVWKIL